MHTQLLKQARHLATRERRRPSQASLRRSVSASYYALFHRLVDEATRMMISRGNRRGLRECFSRAFHHADMQKLCKSLGGSTPNARLRPAFDPLPLDPRLVSLAKSFTDLQDARHQADYNIYRSYTRQEALHFHQLSATALDDWNAIRRTPQGDAFLAALLINQRIQG